MTGISNPYRYSNEAILGFKCCFSDPAPLEFTIKTNPPMRSYSFSFIFIHFHSFSFIFIHFHSFSFIFIHFHFINQRGFHIWEKLQTGSWCSDTSQFASDAFVSNTHVRNEDNGMMDSVMQQHYTK